MGAPLTLTLTLYTVKLGHGYVLAPWDEVDVDGHVGHPYSCNTCTGGVWPSLFPHPSWMYTKCFRYYMYRWGYGRAFMMVRCNGFEAANPH